MGIIVWLIVGLIAGAVARFLVPGPDPMGFLGTLALGLIGSLVGGFLGNLIFHGNLDLEAAGIAGSIIGGVIALLVYRAVIRPRTRRSLIPRTSAGGAPYSRGRLRRVRSRSCPVHPPPPLPTTRQRPTGRSGGHASGSGVAAGSRSRRAARGYAISARTASQVTVTRSTTAITATAAPNDPPSARSATMSEGGAIVIEVLEV